MRFLYPSDPFNKKNPDETYGEEYQAAINAGLLVSLFSFEDFQIGSFKPRPAMEPTDKVLYRGWMLSPEKYETLTQHIENLGATPFTTVSQYRLCHHLPEWYPLLADLSAETITLPATTNFAEALKGLHWEGYFVKDYVKSLTTGPGSLVNRPEDVASVVSLIEQYRGAIEGGVCVRRREEYISSSEERYFVLDGRAYSRTSDVPELVAKCVSLIRSPFYSIDVARRTDGAIRIIELGDGQVSDRKQWGPERFVQMLAEAGP